MTKDNSDYLKATMWLEDFSEYIKDGKILTISQEKNGGNAITNAATRKIPREWTHTDNNVRFR